MPKRLETRIWLSGRSYLFSDLENGEVITPDFKPDSPEYFTWLSTLKSFHFEGKEGRFTARLEARKNKDSTSREYWSAYRKHNKKQLRRYLGQTSNLTIATLEDAAKHLTDVCTSQPTKMKQPRKKPISRAVLLAQISERDRTIEQLGARVVGMEQELTALKLEKARWIVQSRERQI